VVELARSEMKTIIPVCPYVKKVMEETEAFQDVLKKE
jgi:predicted GNAT family acetyltransferase